MLGIAVIGGRPRGVALFGAAPAVGDLPGGRGVVDGVVARVEEDTHSADICRPGCGVQQCTNTEHRRRGTGRFQDVAP